MNKYLIFPEKSERAFFKVENVGGKALHLYKLKNAKINVPDFFVISSQAVNKILDAIRTEIETKCKSLSIISKDIERKTAEIRKKILNLSFDEGLRAEIDSVFSRFGSEKSFFSIRSSVVGEDGAKFSFAGLHNSFLYVKGNDIEQKILACIASAWSFGAISYRLANGLSVSNIQIAVIVQKMVDAEKSGVAFSHNPEGNLNDMLINAGFGLGEGVVSQKVDVDTFLINRDTQKIYAEKSQNKQALKFTHQNGLQICELPASQSSNFVLSNHEVKQVFEQTKICEKLLNAPADVEFSFDRNGKLHVLQMRAITSISMDNVKILDNTNIVESYPEISLPLTFSFALEAYKNVFSATFDAFLLSPKIFEENKHIFSNLLAHYKGRIYYRLDNWYKMMGLIHTSRKSMRAWENAVGLKHSKPNFDKPPLHRKIKIVVSLVRLLLTYKQSNRKFFKEFEKNYKFLKSYKKHLQMPKEIWRHYQKSANLLFKPWYRTLVNDFLSFKSFAVLQNLSTKYKISDRKEFANDILCGTSKVESAEAVLNMLKIKELINGNLKFRKLFDLPVAEIVGFYNKPDFQSLFGEIKNHVEKFGDRTLEELKLENPSFRKNPELFIKLLKNQLKSPANYNDFLKRQNEIHTEAYSLFLSKLRWYNPKRYVFRIAYNLASFGLKSRENMRFSRTRAYGVVKDIFEEIGKMMVAEKIISHQRDVFYLDLKDLQNFCENSDLTSKTKFVKKRKKIYQSYQNLQLPDRLVYSGDAPPEVYKKNFEEKISLEKGVLKGVPVSKGTIKAEVVVIKKPNFNISTAGKIMVSQMTDPGWVFLMAQASGLISEKGSLLSHTAIVGRELGIPVVVGIENATKNLKSGDIVELDGSKGTVKICELALSKS